MGLGDTSCINQVYSINNRHYLPAYNPRQLDAKRGVHGYRQDPAVR